MNDALFSHSASDNSGQFLVVW